MAVLLFFGSIDLVPVPAGQARIDVLLPGTLALAVIAAGLVNLGIATAYERSYGVLKRLGGSPLGRTGLIAAKLATILAIEVVVVLVLMGIAAIVFGWRPGPGVSWPLFGLALLVGTAAFAGLGLALAGTLRAEATLTLANALFIGCPAAGRGRDPAGPPPAAAGGRRRRCSRLAPSWRRSGSPSAGPARPAPPSSWSASGPSGPSAWRSGGSGGSDGGLR